MKYLFLLPLILLSCICLGQNIERNIIRGTIMVPEAEVPEGVHIYNKSSGYGTASDAEGNFELPMATGDTLQVSAVQFEILEVLITREIIDSGRLSIKIKEGLNQLPEILIRSHDLTGNVKEDLTNIEVPKLPTFPPLQDLDGIQVISSSPKNAVTNEIGGGANQLALLIKGIKLLFPERKKKEVPPKTQWTTYEQVVLEKELRSRFDDQFFLDNLGVTVAEISAFVSFVAGKGFSERLLRKDKEIDLIQFLVEQSKIYEGQ